VLARVVRSGLVEAEHNGAVAAVDGDGRLLASTGDPDRAFFLRSAAKPFQATVSQESGAALSLQHMALACASHGGQPVHVAIVRAMLDEVGLDESALKCPPAWPFGEGAQDQLVAAGHRAPRAIWHNCSGKHAAMLRACAAAGWPIETYLDQDHPLQKSIARTMHEVLGADPGPVGIDGCGVPAFRANVRSMAASYARLACDARFAPAWQAMHGRPALTSDQSQPAAHIATWVEAAAKHGAEACLGVAVRNQLGVAVKVWDGSPRAVGVGMVAALDQLGVVSRTAREALQGISHPTVLGGGKPQGVIEPMVQLQW
jgi:L-asparaginase II